MGRTVPEFVSRSVPVPMSSRAPWYKNTFPTYAGIFLWVGFYLTLAGPTLGYASIAVCLWGLLVAGLLCFGLYYYIPAMLGMKTGRPLYVVGTSTFGARGGYIIPGLLMGILQIGWVGLQSYIAANFIMTGLHQTSKALFVVIVIAWVYLLGWIAIKGIQYVGRVSNYLIWIPLIMILIVLWENKGGIAHYQVPHHAPVMGFLSVITIVIGFFATAGAAGADFGMNNANRKDVLLGGIFGIVLGVLVAGGIAILCVAGYLGRTPGAHDYSFSAAISSVGVLAPIMFFLFAIATLVPTCFSSYIVANSFDTLLPKFPRSASTLVALTISIILAATGVASNLQGFFNIVGASFGPVCGAMAADYLYEKRQWSGPRHGINWVGYIAWAIGFLVGIPAQIGLPASWVRADNPSVLYSFVVGFIVYLILAKLGLRPPLAEVGARPVADLQAKTL